MDPLLLGVLVPVTLVAVAGVVRAAREPSVFEYDAEERSDFQDSTGRL